MLLIVLAERDPLNRCRMMSISLLTQEEPMVLAYVIHGMFLWVLGLENEPEKSDRKAYSCPKWKAKWSPSVF